MPCKVRFSLSVVEALAEDLGGAQHGDKGIEVLLVDEIVQLVRQRSEERSHLFQHHQLQGHQQGRVAGVEDKLSAQKEEPDLPVYARDFIELVRRLSDAQI